MRPSRLYTLATSLHYAGVRSRCFCAITIAICVTTAPLHGQTATTRTSDEDPDRITVTGTVMALDLDKRLMTVESRLGQVITLDVPANVGGLEQVKEDCRDVRGTR